jgi:carbon-monoxide dehydrogenase small subunit
MGAMKISLTLNGRAVAAEVSSRTNLADFLREQMLLTGTHVGCEHGICGVCTVEIDGEIARSCITYAVSCDGAHVRTIEGFDDDALMARLRTAFTEEHALQCGYCTPGMLVAARDLVRRKPGLSRAAIRTEMSGNLCRCTGYMGIVSAIERVMHDGGDTARSAAPTRAWLGPAPGPQARSVQASRDGADRDMGGVRTSALAPRAPQHRSGPRTAQRRVPVTVGDVEERDGIVHLSQNFVLEHSRDDVWRLLSDPQAAAACMPGASLDGPPVDGKIKGRMDVKLGPVAASFAGEGTVTQYPQDFRQVIEGQGGDRKSGSRVTGRIDYRLSEAESPRGYSATRVDVVISYGLTGMLAQIGRSGIARDLARHMGEVFAQNTDATLNDPASVPAGHGGLNSLGLAFTLIADRLRGLVRWVLGR